MASSLIRGKYVISKVVSNEFSQIIENGAVYQRDGEIIEVGSYKDLKLRYNADEEIGSSEFVVMPGLVNAHHHVGITPFQLGVPDMPLETWIIARWAIQDVDPYLDTLYCAMQMIESGITTVMHNHSLARLPLGTNMFEASSKVLTAYEESGMRVAFSMGHRDQNRLVYDNDERFLATLPQDLASGVRSNLEANSISLEDYLSGCAELLQSKQSDRAKIFISPANVQWCSDMLLKAIKDLATSHSTGIHIHLQETVYQKMYAIRNLGKTPLAHLYDLGFLGPEVSCAHGVWLTDNDMDILAETGTSICHNPSSNLRLKSGIAPLNMMLEKGVTVAIGIDEAGINDDNDMLQEMRMVQKLHRVPGLGQASPTSHQILNMATVNGAHVTFFGGEVGTLESGKRADIILVSLERIEEPYLDSNTNVVDALLYRGKGLDVDTVIVDGEVILRNRTFANLDKEDIINHLKESLRVEMTSGEVERRELGRQLVPYIQRFFEGWTLDTGTPHYFHNERM